MNINKKLCPFKWFVLENFPFIEADFDAITNWQLMCKLGQEINKVIEKTNLTGKQVEDLTNAFNELQEYVTNYFENLDVQEEINNKLDEMVESGELAEIITEHLISEINKINSRVDINFISPTDKTIDFGDCVVIIGTKNVIIDLGLETTANTILTFLLNNNITKIDYIVISHYHQDHIGGLNGEGLDALLSNSGLDFSNCTVLLPHRGINYSLFRPNGQTIMESIEQTVIGILNNHNVQYYYPAESEKIELSANEYMQFFNLKTEYYNEYYNILNEDTYTNYNNFSMVTLFNHLDNYMWFTGDIEFGAEENIYKAINKCDLIKIEHHAENRRSSPKYLSQLNPKFSVVCPRLLRLEHYNSPTLFDTKSKNSKLYSTYYNSIIHFVSTYNNLYPENATEYVLVNTNLLNTPRSSNSKWCRLK